MSIVDELQSLDANDIGRWPFVFRAAVIGIVFVIVVGAGVYYTIINDKAPALERVQQEELTLRDVFKNKQRKAANYDAYKISWRKWSNHLAPCCGSCRERPKFQV